MMNIDLSQFHFIRPWWLLAAAAFAAVIFLWWYSKRSNNAWRKIVDQHLLSFLLSKQSAQQKMPLKSACVAGLLATLALAGPTISKLPQPAIEKAQARIILLDLSFSMFAEDIKPSRIQRSIHKALDILDKTGEGSIGLVVYAGDAFTISPLTSDSNTVKSLVPSVSPAIMPVLGSDPGKGFLHTLQLLENTQVNRGHIIWITDGIDASDVERIELILNGTQHKVSILAVGTQEGAPIPLPNNKGFLKEDDGSIVVPQLSIELIQQLSSNINARFTTLTADDSDINYLLTEDIFSNNNDYTELLEQQGFDIWQDLGPYLLLFLLPFVLLAFRRGLIFCLPLLLMLPAENSHAFSWQDLWKNGNQQGQEAYQQQNYDQAAAKFSDPIWKGSALYKKGDFEKAISAFEQEDSSEASYNIGNAHAKLGNFEHAIEAYNEAIKKNPEHQDAIHNKKLIEDLLKQQQNQQQKGESSNQENQQQEQQNQQQDQQQSQQQSGEQQQSEQQQQSQQQEDQQESQSQEPSQEQSQEQSEKQAEEKEQGEGEEKEQKTAQASEEQSDEDKEFEQTLTQWLRKVPDDPARLLREKMRYEYQKRGHKNKQKKKIW